MPKPIDIRPGQRFGRWTVLREGDRRPLPSVRGPGLRMFWCQCECGTTRQVTLANLRNRPNGSCGCRQREAAIRSNIARAKHRMGGHPLYSRWSGMMTRCYNPRTASYRNYGGRGIKVCPEWHDAAAFIGWIEANLGPRPDGMTLDRIDVNGNYEPGNLRWATASQQQRNKRPWKRRKA